MDIVSFQTDPKAEWMQFFITSALRLPESVFSFPMSWYRFDNAVFCQFFQKLRCSGRLNIDNFHHIRPSKDRPIWKRLTKFEDVAFCFGLKQFLNVRFSPFNVRFCHFNVRFFCFFKGTTDVQCRLWSGWCSFSKRFLKNSSRYSVVSWIPFFRSL